MIGAVIAGVYVVYRILKWDPISKAVGGLAEIGKGTVGFGEAVVTGWQEIFGGIHGAAEGIWNTLTGKGQEKELKSGVYVAGEYAGPPREVTQQMIAWREELPTVEPLVEKAIMAGLPTPAFAIRQMARGAATEQLIRTEGYRLAMEARAAAGQ
mgnify:CR=1 FL=1